MPNRLAKLACRCAAAAVIGAMALAGCTEKPDKPQSQYTSLPPRKVPAYLKDTILQFVDLSSVEPYAVSGFGLVANLNGTGGTHAPTHVREYIQKEMARHGFGSLGSGMTSPDDALRSRQFAIVRVDGLIPPGARSGTGWSTWFDVRVSSLPESDTTSLAHGDLYECDLKVEGANPLDPGSGHVQVMAQARGPVFVNPAYSLDESVDTPAARAARRNGIVLGGARAVEDRPIVIRLRQPQRAMSRAIQDRIVEFFQDQQDDDLRHKGLHGVADAQDEAVILTYPPKMYGDDWQHFVGVLRHLYMSGADPRFAAVMAKQLADEAVKPDAPLQDISYCWEGLGKPALFAVTPLLHHADPQVQFAAARAGAFIGDAACPAVLAQIAQQPGNPFRISAVQVLGALPQSPVIDRLLRPLLSCDQALVRVEAYQVLARHLDPLIITRVVKHGENEKFVLDLVRCQGQPMIYATQSGLPRLAVFVPETALEMPMMFSAMQGRLSIASSADGSRVTAFYRDPLRSKPARGDCPPDVAELVLLLSGDPSAILAGNSGFDFGYGDIVAILQALTDQQKISGPIARGASPRQAATFMLQPLPSLLQAVQTASPLATAGRGDGSRPQGNEPAGGQGTGQPIDAGDPSPFK